MLLLLWYSLTNHAVTQYNGTVSSFWLTAESRPLSQPGSSNYSRSKGGEVCSRKLTHLSHIFVSLNHEGIYRRSPADCYLTDVLVWFWFEPLAYWTEVFPDWFNKSSPCAYPDACCVSRPESRQCGHCEHIPHSKALWVRFSVHTKDLMSKRIACCSQTSQFPASYFPDFALVATICSLFSLTDCSHPLKWRY